MAVGAVVGGDVHPARRRPPARPSTTWRTGSPRTTHEPGLALPQRGVERAQRRGEVGRRRDARPAPTAPGRARTAAATAAVAVSQASSRAGLSARRRSRRNHITVVVGHAAHCARPRDAPQPRRWDRMDRVSDLIDTTEMYLRTIYELVEEGIVPLRARIAERLHQSGPTVSQTVARMERDGLLTVEGDRHLELTDEGTRLAVRVMRKHRLAERLLTDVIGLDWELVHAEACRWEHVMSETVERRLRRAARPPDRVAVRQPDPRAGRARRDPATATRSWTASSRCDAVASGSDETARAGPPDRRGDAEGRDR